MSLYQTLTSDLYAARRSALIEIAILMGELLSNSTVMPADERFLADVFNRINPLNDEAEEIYEQLLEMFTLVGWIDRRIDKIERTLEGCV